MRDGPPRYGDLGLALAFRESYRARVMEQRNPT